MQVKINIEEPKKANKLTDAQYLKRFSKWNPLQASLKETNKQKKPLTTKLSPFSVFSYVLKT